VDQVGVRLEELEEAGLVTGDDGLHGPGKRSGGHPLVRRHLRSPSPLSMLSRDGRHHCDRAIMLSVFDTVSILPSGMIFTTRRWPVAAA
jgi:hypothetical protein